MCEQDRQCSMRVWTEVTATEQKGKERFLVATGTNQDEACGEENKEQGDVAQAREQGELSHRRQPILPVLRPPASVLRTPTTITSQHLLPMDLPGRTTNTTSKGGKVPVTVFTGFVGVGKTVIGADGYGSITASFLQKSRG